MDAYIDQKTHKETQKKPCLRCLLAESGRGELEKIQRLIALMPPEERASKEVYNSRLSVCGACDALADGQCRKCGCYVELRAAAKNARCPSEKRLW